MARSGFDYSGAGQAAKNGPWMQSWVPGPGLANLFALYPSRGAATITTATSIPSTLDGPIQVVRYGALTVNAALTLTNRCRGGVILADSLSMGAAGAFSMSARGAAGCSKWANQDIGIPTSIALSGRTFSQRAFLNWLATTGYCIWDPTLFAAPLPGMGDVQADWADWPAKMAAIVSAAGCGARIASPWVPTGNHGYTGSAGSLGGTGGGGSGAASFGGVATWLPNTPGLVWGGGAGQNGQTSLQLTDIPADWWGGKGGSIVATSNAGGGAGNPSGSGLTASSGTGGVLVVIVRGNVTLAAGHALSSNGMPGESSSSGGGGGSGAGSVSLFYGGSLTGTPNMTATGGAYGTGSPYHGGAGGAGSTQVKTFAQMGWA